MPLSPYRGVITSNESGKMEKAYGSNIYHTASRKSSQKSPFSAILKENLPPDPPVEAHRAGDALRLREVSR
jgi:hypothetical protein